MVGSIKTFTNRTTILQNSTNFIILKRTKNEDMLYVDSRTLDDDDRVRVFIRMTCHPSSSTSYSHSHSQALTKVHMVVEAEADERTPTIIITNFRKRPLFPRKTASFCKFKAVLLAHLLGFSRSGLWLNGKIGGGCLL